MTTPCMVLRLAAFGAAVAAAIFFATPAEAAGASREHAFDAAIAAAIADARHIYPVPAELARAVICQESGFQPGARSRAGAIGLMQVMPYNARPLGLRAEDLVDPARNVLAGVRFLAVLLKHYRGDVVSALVAYNARPRKLGAPVPQNGETPGYVSAVLVNWRRYARESGREGPKAERLGPAMAGESPVRATPGLPPGLPLRPSRRVD